MSPLKLTYCSLLSNENGTRLVMLSVYTAVFFNTLNKIMTWCPPIPNQHHHITSLQKIRKDSHKRILPYSLYIFFLSLRMTLSDNGTLYFLQGAPQETKRQPDELRWADESRISSSQGHHLSTSCGQPGVHDRTRPQAIVTNWGREGTVCIICFIS